jgi:uncharacterized protein YciI
MMFVVTLTYVVDPSEVDAIRPDHVAWLKRQFAAGAFVASGRRQPPIGGVILAGNISRAELDRALAGDPYAQQGVAAYEIVEFVPSSAAAGFEGLLEPPR